MVESKDQNLASGQRRNIQLKLAFPEQIRGEAPKDSGEGTEPLAAATNSDDSVKLVSLMEEVLDPQNLNRAYLRILSNRGARTPGVDGMTVQQLKASVRKHWPKIEAQLRAGTYRPGLDRAVQAADSGTNASYTRRLSGRSDRTARRRCGLVFSVSQSRLIGTVAAFTGFSVSFPILQAACGPARSTSRAA